MTTSDNGNGDDVVKQIQPLIKQDLTNLDRLATEAASDLMNRVIDEVNDIIHKCPAVIELRNLILLQEVGRIEPQGDDDKPFYQVLSALYTKIFLECASKQWFIESSAREYYKLMYAQGLLYHEFSNEPLNPTR